MQINRYLKTGIGSTATRQQKGRNTRRSYIKNNLTTRAVVVAEAAIEKYFTNACRALEEEAGRLQIHIYSGNNSIKAHYLIHIQLLAQLSKLAFFLYRVILLQLCYKKQVTFLHNNSPLVLELGQAIVYKRLLLIRKYLMNKVQAIIKIGVIIISGYRRNIRLVGQKVRQIITDKLFKAVL